MKKSISTIRPGMLNIAYKAQPATYIDINTINAIEYLLDRGFVDNNLG